MPLAAIALFYLCFNGLLTAGVDATQWPQTAQEARHDRFNGLLTAGVDATWDALARRKVEMVCVSMAC